MVLLWGLKCLFTEFKVNLLSRGVEALWMASALSVTFSFFLHVVWPQAFPWGGAFGNFVARTRLCWHDDQQTHRRVKLIRSAFVCLRLDWLRTSKLDVTYTSRPRNPLLRSKPLLMKSSQLARRFMVFGISYLRSLAANQSQPPVQSLWRKRSKPMLLLTRLRSRSTLSET